MDTMNQKPMIGKDVIETLTLGMYEDSRFIFREYIQNSADQIDKAVELGILENRCAGQIDIMIDPEIRRVQVEDNATGIESSNVLDILGNIAVSQKDRTKQRGFRGIGRLGGLGYCRELTFVTSAIGEPVRTILTWDANKLKKIINDRDTAMEASELIRQITQIRTEEEKEEQHYFRVIMHDVSNDVLLDSAKVETYLRMVAPIPFATGFIYKSKIREALEKREAEMDEFRVFVNTNQIYKSYSTILYSPTKSGKKSIDEIYDIEFREIKSGNELVGLLWFGISKFEKRLPVSVNPACGIRIRKGNIQIGDNSTVVKYFKEPRGNYYFIGELHAVHPELIPNARRDFFIENYYCKVLEEGLEQICKGELHKLYHQANTLKNAKRRIEKVSILKEEFKKKLEKGFTSKEEKHSLESEFEKAKQEAIAAKAKISSYAQRREKLSPSLSKVMDKVIDNPTELNPEELSLNEPENGKTIFRTDSLSKLSRDQRKFLGRIFEIIKNELTPDRAEFLLNKIEEELK